MEREVSKNVSKSYRDFEFNEHPISKFFEDKHEYFEKKSSRLQTLYVLEQWRTFYKYIIPYLDKKSESYYLFQNIKNDLSLIHELLYDSLKFKNKESARKVECKLKTVNFNFRTLSELNKIHFKKMLFIESNLIYFLLSNSKHTR